MWLFGFSGWMSEHSGSECKKKTTHWRSLSFWLKMLKLTSNMYLCRKVCVAVCAVNSVKHSETVMCVCVSKCKSKWFLKKTCLEWPEKPYKTGRNSVSCLWGTWAIQDKTYRRGAIGNTTLIDLVHFSDLKLPVLISNIKSKTATVSFTFTLKHCFSPVHLWVAKYSCISVWNDWETISRWHTLQLDHGGSALRQQLIEFISKAS